MVLDASLGLVDDHVFAERFDGSVVVEFRSAIVAFGRGREDLDQDKWIEQRVGGSSGAFRNFSATILRVIVCVASQTDPMPPSPRQRPSL